MNLQKARQSKKRQSYRQKYYQNSQEKPLGKYKLLMADYHQGDPFLTLGPNYAFFGLTFIIINLVTAFLLYRLNQKEDTKTFFLILTVVTIFLDTVWLASAFINPGIATVKSDQQGEVCQVCQADNSIEIVKKIERYHCQQCDICIDEQQTHMKFIGGCVGKNNFIVFKLLLLGIFMWGLSMITIVPLTSNL